MADDLMYFLIQWEDRFMSVIDIKHIVKPVKNKFVYKEGENIRAQFGKKNSYEAVICEIHLTIVEDSKAGHLLMKPRPESITSMETDSVKKRDFDELQDQVRRLKKRVRELEKFQDSEKSSNKASNLPEGPILSSHSESPSSPSQKPCEEYNGYTEPQLKDMICHEDSLFECCKKLLALFSTDYITTHSVTGRRANTSTEPKPKFDPRLYACLSKVLKEKFPGTKDTEITLKVRAVQKKCKKANQ
ncbi:uncharacterized protein LOC128546157 isoform X3 [Mercenaria mercenaria]|uniref:uncharacterized protein LOC128546157 isoform X3 n=1 Tax=Mercenaria mercenaria TaxID=6596 RepID=UPI00234F15CE|nr:uncharacterized protein LOC128546157 isoform X3 [Mercenaria mercenaria]